MKGHKQKRGILCVANRNKQEKATLMNCLKIQIMAWMDKDVWGIFFFFTVKEGNIFLILFFYLIRTSYDLFYLFFILGYQFRRHFRVQK